MSDGRSGDQAGTSASPGPSLAARPAAANQYEYDRADAPADALRLHLNEHTGGCSPAVIEAIARVTRETIAKYPDYTAVTRAVADHLDVPTSRVLLTNGLDEGIFAVAIAQLRGTRSGRDHRG